MSTRSTVSMIARSFSSIASSIASSIGGEDFSENLGRHKNIAPRKDSVSEAQNDPTVKKETAILEEENSSKERNDLLIIVVIIGLLSVVLLTLILLYLLHPPHINTRGEQASGGESKQQSESRTEAIWIDLILSQSPSTDFSVLQPARQALDWMLQDSYTVSQSDSDQRLLIQRFALLVFFYSTTGPRTWTNLRGWTNDSSDFECEWTGIECDASNIATSIALSLHGLYGELPGEIGLLSSLKTLSLWENEIGGTIPTEVGLLKQLTHIDLSANQLVGRIPTDFGNLSALTQLKLHTNKLVGPIPRQLVGLRNIETLSLYDNGDLTGIIPSRFCLSPDLIEVIIDCDKVNCVCCEDLQGTKCNITESPLRR